MTEQGEQVNVKVASSFISLEQAELNLNQEIGQKAFKDIKSQAKASWENEFQRLIVEDDNIDNIRLDLQTRLGFLNNHGIRENNKSSRLFQVV